MIDDRDDHGIDPKFKGLLGALLEDAPVVMAVQHLKKRGKPGAVCGGYGGQIVCDAIGITCPACLVLIARRKGRRS